MERLARTREACDRPHVLSDADGLGESYQCVEELRIWR